MSSGIVSHNASGIFLTLWEDCEEIVSGDEYPYYIGFEHHQKHFSIMIKISVFTMLMNVQTFANTMPHIAFRAYATLKKYSFSKIHTMFSPQNLWLIKPKIKWICSGSAEKKFFWSYRTTQILTFPISCIQIVMVGLSMTMEWSYMAQISLLITPDTFGT